MEPQEGLEASGACRIEDIVESWRRLRGEGAGADAQRDCALSSTMLLAPDGANVFRVMVSGAHAQRWSGLSLGAAFVSMLAPGHRPQMQRRLTDSARRQLSSLTRARSSHDPDAALDVLVLPLRRAVAGERFDRIPDGMVLVGLSPVMARTTCRNVVQNISKHAMRDMILECSGPLPELSAPVMQP